MEMPHAIDPDSSEHVYTFVRAVPPARVVTYGQVADMLDAVRLTPRQVGSAMRTAPPGVPWHRVVGAGGLLPIGRRSLEMRSLQRELLEQEGVSFMPGDRERVDMRRCQWIPDLDTASPLADLC